MKIRPEVEDDAWRRLDTTLVAIHRTLQDVERQVEEADALLRGAPELLPAVCGRLVESEDRLERLEREREEALTVLGLHRAVLTEVRAAAPPELAARLDERHAALEGALQRLEARCPTVAARAHRFAEAADRLSDDL